MAGALHAVEQLALRFYWIHIVSPFEQGFSDRIRSYQPSLIINACTVGVRGLVDTTLKGLGRYRVVGVSHHPSYWSRVTRLIP